MNDERKPGERFSCEVLPIKNETRGGLLVGAVVMIVATIAQIVGLVLYVRRLPDDWIGIGLYLFTAIWFFVVAVLLLRKRRRIQRPPA